MITVYGVISDKRENHLKAEKWVFRTILLMTIKFRKFEICPKICTEPQSLIIIIIMIIILRNILTPKLLLQCYVSKEAHEVWEKFSK